MMKSVVQRSHSFYFQIVFYMLVSVHVGRITLKQNFVTAASKTSRGAEDPNVSAMWNEKKKEAIKKVDEGFFDKGWLDSADADPLYLNYLNAIAHRHSITIEIEEELGDGDDDADDAQVAADIDLTGDVAADAGPVSPVHSSDGGNVGDVVVGDDPGVGLGNYNCFCQHSFSKYVSVSPKHRPKN